MPSISNVHHGDLHADYKRQADDLKGAQTDFLQTWIHQIIILSNTL